MKRLVIVGCCLLMTTPVLAQTAPASPTTLAIPTADVSALLQYLAQKPYAESAIMISELQGCVRVQVPDARGAIVSHGECPSVTEALAAQTKQIADLTKQVADAKASKAAPDAPKTPAPEGK